jgi:hypothetical protein
VPPPTRQTIGATERRLILHVGAPKCGSTALQTVLSNAPEFGDPLKERIRYGAIDLRGHVHFGVDVKRRAAFSLSGASASANAKPLSELPSLMRMVTAASLNWALTKTSVVLSQEGWFAHPDAFAATGLPKRLLTPIDIVAYIRPQTDFINAAWWQWGVWSGQPFARWLSAQKAQAGRWHESLGAWRSLPNVRHLHLRLLTNDIVGDFFEIIGSPPPESQPANRSLPGLAVRFLQRHPELRAVSDHAPGLVRRIFERDRLLARPQPVDIHFVLANALAHLDQPNPWVLPSDFVGDFIQSCQDSNRALRAMLDPDSQARMDADPRWWDADAYAHKTQEPAEAQPPDIASSDDLAVALAMRLLAAERELAATKSRQIR